MILPITLLPFSVVLSIELSLEVANVLLGFYRGFNISQLLCYFRSIFVSQVLYFFSDRANAGRIFIWFIIVYQFFDLIFYNTYLLLTILEPLLQNKDPQ